MPPSNGSKHEILLLMVKLRLGHHIKLLLELRPSHQTDSVRFRDVSAGGATIAVVGAGYVGLTTALGLAELDYRVNLVERDRQRLKLLNDGALPFQEPGLGELLEQHLGKNLQVFGDLMALNHVRFVFLCVATPTSTEGSADLSAVESALQEVMRVCPTATFVLKSSVPPGTATRLSSELGIDPRQLVSNPEFLREGYCLKDFMTPDRIVIGSWSHSTSQQVADLYSQLRRPIIMCSTTEAELIKYASNSALAVKISFANEISDLCVQLEAQTSVVLEGVGADSRIGPAMMKPGPGWGGSCLPKDTQAILHLARSEGIRLSVIEAAVTSNSLRTKSIADLVNKLFEQEVGTHVAVWGLAFKAETDDLRDSPALEIIGHLVSGGLKVVAYDPAILPNDTRVDSRITVAESMADSCRDAGLLLVLTEWRVFSEAPVAQLTELFKGKTIVDTRAILSRGHWTEYGFRFVDSLTGGGSL